MMRDLGLADGSAADIHIEIIVTHPTVPHDATLRTRTHPPRPAAGRRWSLTSTRVNATRARAVQLAIRDRPAGFDQARPGPVNAPAGPPQLSGSSVWPTVVRPEGIQRSEPATRTVPSRSGTAPRADSSQSRARCVVRVDNRVVDGMLPGCQKIQRNVS